MLESCIYNILDHILPNAGKSKHDILRLEYISACNIMQNEMEIFKTLPLLPVRLYEPLLQSVIYNSYLKFINSLDIYRLNCGDSWQKICIPFPETLVILVLNWPHEELILRNQIPSLEPPVDIFPSCNGLLVSQTHATAQVGYMLRVFNIFCARLIQFIIKSVFSCTPANTQGKLCNLRRLDVSGLGNIKDYGYDLLSYKIYNSVSDDILNGIRNSSIDTFGCRFEVFADAGPVIIRNRKFELLKDTIEQSLKPDSRISVYFKSINFTLKCRRTIFPNDLYNLLDAAGCKYIKLWTSIDQRSFENICIHLPGLVGLSLPSSRNITHLDVLGSFQYLEQLRIREYVHTDLTNALCKMSKGLSYLCIEGCVLKRQDFESLANSNHTKTLLQLDFRNIQINNDADADGLTILCQKLKNIKVLSLDYCSLETLSPNIVSKLVNAFRACDQLEFLSIKHNSFSVEIITIILDGLTQKDSLRYLSLDLPNMPGNAEDHDEDWDVGDENMEYQPSLCKILHDKINEFRQSPIYISWCQ